VTTNSDPFSKISFLIGDWEGRGEGFDTGKDSDITNKMSFAFAPSPSIITGRFEARRAGKLENEGAMIILYDPNIRRFVRKTVYSYGFIMNEIGTTRGNRFLFDCVGIDALPDYWKGLRIRTFLEKKSEDEFTSGLMTAKKGEAFHVYGQNRFRRRRA
jgi:hypothetical protein